MSDNQRAHACRREAAGYRGGNDGPMTITTTTTINELLAHPHSAVRAFAHVAITNPSILRQHELDQQHAQDMLEAIWSVRPWRAVLRGLYRRANLSHPERWRFRDLVVVGRACGLRPSEVMQRVSPRRALTAEELEAAPWCDPALIEYRIRTTVMQRGRDLGARAHAMMSAHAIDYTRKNTWLYWPPHPRTSRDDPAHTTPMWGTGYRIIAQPMFCFRCMEFLFGLDLAAAACTPQPDEPAPTCRFNQAP
jgi:hypothetical protein